MSTTERAVDETTALELYAEGLAETTQPAAIGDAPWFLRYDDGDIIPLELSRWCSDAVAGDEGLVRRCTGPTLDVGCGPGRLAAAVGRRGLPVLGLDISPAAITMARNRGALVVQRSVFDELPGEGSWQHVLLADGNVGIGGDPARLLSRCLALLQDEGTVLVEVDGPGTPTKRCEVRIESLSGRISGSFPWAHVGVDDVDLVAASAGLQMIERWSENGRWFVTLSR